MALDVVQGSDYPPCPSLTILDPWTSRKIKSSLLKFNYITQNKKFGSRRIQIPVGHGIFCCVLQHHICCMCSFSLFLLTLPLLSPMITARSFLLIIGLFPLFLMTGSGGIIGLWSLFGQQVLSCVGYRMWLYISK